MSGFRGLAVLRGGMIAAAPRAALVRRGSVAPDGAAQAPAAAAFSGVEGPNGCDAGISCSGGTRSSTSGASPMSQVGNRPPGVFADPPLSTAFARDLDAPAPVRSGQCARAFGADRRDVDQQMQPAVRAATGGVPFRVFWRRDSVLRSRPAQSRPVRGIRLATKPPRHGHPDPWRSRWRDLSCHRAQQLHRKAGPDGGGPVAGLPPAPAGRRRFPGHRRVEPALRRSKPIGRWMVSA